MTFRLILLRFCLSLVAMLWVFTVHASQEILQRPTPDAVVSHVAISKKIIQKSEGFQGDFITVFGVYHGKANLVTTLLAEPQTYIVEKKMRHGIIWLNDDPQAMRLSPFRAIYTDGIDLEDEVCSPKDEREQSFFNRQRYLGFFSMKIGEVRRDLPSGAFSVQVYVPPNIPEGRYHLNVVALGSTHSGAGFNDVDRVAKKTMEHEIFSTTILIEHIGFERKFRSFSRNFMSLYALLAMAIPLTLWAFMRAIEKVQQRGIF